MFSLTAAIFLLSVIATSASDIAEDLNLPPLSNPLYVFDVTSEASAEEVKSSLSGLQVVHCYKVVGENRFIVVAASKDAEVLRQLTFPPRSVSTQYPVQHASDFYHIADENSAWVENDSLDMGYNDVWFLHRIEVHLPINTAATVYKAMTLRYEQQYAILHDQIKVLTYYSVARYPPTMYYFSNIEDAAATQIALDGADAFGGPSNFIHISQHIVKI